MPNHGSVPREDWDIRLWRMMIKGGTDGVQHNTIIHTLQSVVDAQMIRNKLEAWFAEQKVQKFEQKTKGRPRIIWRATTLLLKEFDKQEDTEDDGSEE